MGNTKNIATIALLVDEELRYFLIEELELVYNIALEATDSTKDILYIREGNRANIADIEKLATRPPYFASLALLSPTIMEYRSITDASNILRSLGRNWAAYCKSSPSDIPYGTGLYRRTVLIREKLPYVNYKARTFEYYIEHPLPSSAMGFFTLIDRHTMLVSLETSSFLPLGKLELIEDHIEPPSRAYLKLQEALLRYRLHYNVELPTKQDKVLDAGASPGGWTWVLSKLGCAVTAIDKAPLSSSLNAPNIRYIKGSAFSLSGNEDGYTWVFSDMACYPERLLEWVKLWCRCPNPPNMICTIKLVEPKLAEGKEAMASSTTSGTVSQSSFDTIGKFSSIPGGYVVHLGYNKHELTFMYHHMPYSI